jgi:hypothetical protein
MSGEVESNGGQSGTGPTAFLAKPFPLDQLLMTVASELAKQERPEN